MDLIDRQAAIDAIKTWGLIDGLSEGQAIEILTDEEKLPPAQSEIVRCKECGHRNGDYCHRFHDGYSAFIHHDDYCSYAERVNNELV